ncbi:nitrate- and nitrite sensing domain-containing protein [Nocardioides albus]|uniref:Nitrate/nitrite sensing protein domain-containing protein n=1 Tax=Nocardioides albus TaxID=1841 RepID=A0A7W5F6U5_9ACTN|nr:nitrate- and nitrite sensing domain-containing protein [Nocardioides albus]MBB3087490.1 hypothetical protein [Nocardioides albus]GGU09373.1 hypothetical protein GCM10007979_04130 [Nocardioides albus]
MNTFDDDTLLREGLYRIGGTAPVPRIDPSEDIRRGRRRVRRNRLVATAGTVMAVGVIALGGVALRPVIADRATDPAGSPTSTSTSVSRAESVAQALPSTFDLAITLTFEGNAVEAGVPDVVMKPMHAATDEAITIWTAKAERIDAGEDQELAAAISGVQRSLEALPETRSKIRTKETRVEGALAYASLSDDLLAISTLVPPVGDAEIDAEIEALGHLRSAFESFRREQAIMTTALAKREVMQRMGAAGESLSKAELADLADAEATWRRSLADFHTSTSDRQRESLDLITRGTATEGAIGAPAQQVVDQILSAGNLDRVTMVPDEYVMFCTELIRAMQKLSVAAANEIIEDLAALD